MLGGLHVQSPKDISPAAATSLAWVLFLWVAGIGAICLRCAWSVFQYGTPHGPAPATAILMLCCGIAIVASSYGLLNRRAWGVHVFWSGVFGFGVLLGVVISGGGRFRPVQGGLYQRIEFGEAVALIGVLAILLTAVALAPLLVLRRLWRPNSFDGSRKKPV